MRVEYSQQVKQNIAEIADYTEKRWGTAKRIEFIGQIADCFQAIAEFPRGARFDVDLGLHYKLVPSLPFIIVYAVRTDVIRAIKIVHTKRNR